MLPFNGGFALFILLVVIFFFLGWRNLKKPALATGGLILALKLVTFQSAIASKTEMQKLLGVPVREPSFFTYALESILFVCVWFGLAYLIGKWSGKIGSRLKSAKNRP